jgi:hypothetical protein
MDPSGEPLQETNRAPRDQNIHRTQHCESIQEKERQMKNKPLNIGISLQDKYGLGGTKVSDYMYDKDGNVKLDTVGIPVKRINSYLTADIKIDEESKNGKKIR